jgi:hypothetical protein
MLLPSTWKRTEATATLPEAFAEIDTTRETVALFAAGAVNETVGRVVFATAFVTNVWSADTAQNSTWLPTRKQYSCRN